MYKEKEKINQANENNENRKTDRKKVLQKNGLMCKRINLLKQRK